MSSCLRLPEEYDIKLRGSNPATGALIACPDHMVMKGFCSSTSSTPCRDSDGNNVPYTITCAPISSAYDINYGNHITSRSDFKTKIIKSRYIGMDDAETNKPSCPSGYVAYGGCWSQDGLRPECVAPDDTKVSSLLLCTNGLNISESDEDTTIRTTTSGVSTKCPDGKVITNICNSAPYNRCTRGGDGQLHMYDCKGCIDVSTEIDDDTFIFPFFNMAEIASNYSLIEDALFRWLFAGNTVDIVKKCQDVRMKVVNAPTGAVVFSLSSVLLENDSEKVGILIRQGSIDWILYPRYDVDKTTDTVTDLNSFRIKRITATSTSYVTTTVLKILPATDDDYIKLYRLFLIPPPISSTSTLSISFNPQYYVNYASLCCDPDRVDSINPRVRSLVCAAIHASSLDSLSCQNPRLKDYYMNYKCTSSVGKGTVECACYINPKDLNDNPNNDIHTQLYLNNLNDTNGEKIPRHCILPSCVASEAYKPSDIKSCSKVCSKLNDPSQASEFHTATVDGQTYRAKCNDDNIVVPTLDVDDPDDHQDSDQCKVTYGPWSECSKPCGGGKKTRKFIPDTSNEICAAKKLDDKWMSCNVHACSDNNGKKSSKGVGDYWYIFLIAGLFFFIIILKLFI